MLYSNVNQDINNIIIVPVTNSWREELEKKTQNAILRAMGQQIPPHSRDDQTGTGKENQFDHFQDEKVDNYSNMKILYKTLPVRARGINGSVRVGKVNINMSAGPIATPTFTYHILLINIVVSLFVAVVFPMNFYAAYSNYLIIPFGYDVIR